jgi:hypothetical protein
MPNNAPVYLVYSEDRKLAHICVGKDPVTLCNKRGIKSAVQIQDREKPIEKVEDNGENICSGCRDKWNKISDDISLERTIDCHRCGSVYSANLSGVVEHMDGGEVPVCKPCYKELYESSDSGVNIPYEEVEKYYENSSSRTIELDLEE